MGVDARSLARLLAVRGAILTGDFTLSSGRKSSVYIDARLLLGDSYTFGEALELLDRAAPQTGFEAVLGVATAGIPWAAGLALRRGLPMGYVRPERKSHGTGRRVEGAPPRGRVILVDDVATTGRSLLQAASAAREEGYEPIAAVVLVDREEGASEALEKEGLELRRVATLSEILEELGLKAL